MAMYVYLLRCGDGKYYIGQTQDLEKRLEHHRKKPSVYMKSRLPITLLGCIQVKDRAEAMALEKRLKGMKKREAVLKCFEQYGGLSSAG